MRNVSKFAWLAGILLTWSVTDGAEFSDLVDYVPDNANAMVLVNAKALFASPVAKRENWEAKRQKQFEGGLTVVPPNADKIVIAAHLDVEVMNPSWEVAVAEMESQVTLASLAERFAGKLDKVNSVPAVQLPDDSFVVQFADGLFGAMSPGHRQQVARWVARKNRGLSPYLLEGVRFANAQAEVIMVLDLQHAFDADTLQGGLEGLESVKKSKVDTAKLAELFASVRGVALGIHFGERPFGRLKIDFDQDASMLSPMVKPLILDVLGSYGVMFDELAGWKPQIKGNQVSLGGPLTYDGLIHLSSLAQLPTSAFQHAAASPSPSVPATGSDPTKDSSVLETTKKYYQSVEQLLRRLEDKRRSLKTMGQSAQWFENYGRHVDRLPTLHVDKEMLQYGAYISSQLHNASMTLKGTTIQRRVDIVAADDSAKIYGGAIGNVSQDNWQASGVGYGGGLGVNYGRRRETNAIYGLARRGGVVGARNSLQRQQQQADTAVDVQARAQAASSTQQIIQNIESATTQIRESMTEKYQVQF